MYFDISPNKTVDRIGVPEVIELTTGTERRQITVVLTTMANGRMPPPVIIFKAKRKLNIHPF